MERKGIKRKVSQIGLVFVLGLLLLGLTHTKASATAWSDGFGEFEWNSINVTLASFGVGSFADLGSFSLIECTEASPCAGLPEGEDFTDGVDFTMTAGPGLSFQTGQEMGVAATDGSPTVTTFGALDPAPCGSGLINGFSNFEILCDGAGQPQSFLRIHLAGLAETDFLTNSGPPGPGGYFFGAHLINQAAGGCSAKVAFGIEGGSGAEDVDAEGCDGDGHRVPEPATLILLGSGLLGLGLWGRRKFKV
jgi:hypothetical protein